MMYTYKLREKLTLIFFGLLLLLSGSLLLIAPKTNAQAGAAKPLCYIDNAVLGKPMLFPMCNYEALEAGGFDMGSLPNPFPAEKVCYYFAEGSAGAVVDCEDPKFKNSGESSAPPLSTRCFIGETGPDNKQVYAKVDCTADFQSQIGKALEANTCYVIDKKGDQVIRANSIDCEDPIVKGAKDGTDPIGTGTIRTTAPGACPNVQTTFFGLPTWYKYLEVGDNCAVKLDFKANPNQIWLIALAIADILLWIAGFVAVLFVILGGYKYITSQFDPEGTKNARDTILNALIGLAVAVIAAALVNFVGRTIG